MSTSLDQTDQMVGFSLVVAVIDPGDLIRAAAIPRRQVVDRELAIHASRFVAEDDLCHRLALREGTEGDQGRRSVVRHRVYSSLADACSAVGFASRAALRILARIIPAQSGRNKVAGGRRVPDLR